MTVRTICLIVLLASLTFAQNRQANYPPDLPGAQVEVYKTAGDVKLNMYIVNPDGHSASDKRPAIVFFFGGGWRGGTPKQFFEHSKYLASRGMVAMMADYRVSSRHQTKVVDCVEDAKSAIRWVRSNASRLGIDPNRIAAGGGSAGGHLAAATGTVPGLDAPGEDTSVSARPNALVLFNPAVVFTPARLSGLPPDRLAGLVARVGGPVDSVSPYSHVSKKTPPAIIFHGKADTTVPFRSAQAFTKKMKETSVPCELIGYDGAAHGFFNYGRAGNKAYIDTLSRADKFLASLDYLEGPPTLKE